MIEVLDEGGFIGDRVGRRGTFLTNVGLACLCVFVLPFVHSNLVVYATLFGFGVALGPLASLWSPIVLTRFEHENATTTVGLLNIATAGVAFLAPLTISVLHTVTGGHILPFVVLGVVTALGAFLFRWGTNSKSGNPNRSPESLGSEPAD